VSGRVDGPNRSMPARFRSRREHILSSAVRRRIPWGYAAPPLRDGVVAMTDFTHAREFLNAGDVVVVSCSHQCNVMLMDDTNFRSYRSGSRFSYYGGHYAYFPAQITVPQTGGWNIVLDLGGGAAHVRYSFNVIGAAA
jgi:Domain of unknown function (DUF1883)